MTLKRIVLTPDQAVAHVLWERWPELMTTPGLWWHATWNRDPAAFLTVIGPTDMRTWSMQDVEASLASSGAPWPLVRVTFHGDTADLQSVTLQEAPG